MSNDYLYIITDSGFCAIGMKTEYDDAARLCEIPNPVDSYRVLALEDVSDHDMVKMGFVTLEEMDAAKAAYKQKRAEKEKQDAARRERDERYMYEKLARKYGNPTP